MAASRLERDIRAQADSLTGVFNHHLGAGKSSLREAAAMVASSSKVLITGMGASMFAAIPLQYALCARGIDAVIVEAGELLHYLHEAFSDALVIIVSRSGESVEIARLLSILPPHRRVVGITNEPGSMLARSANVTLQIGSLPDEFVAIQTYTGTLLTLQMLAEAAAHPVDENWEHIEILIPAMGDLIARTLDDLTAWDPFLADQSPVHLLARGPSMASALEGALLFNEIAKHLAIAMPIASFRHGPVELVDESFRGMLFAPTGKTRDLTLSLASDLQRFGGKIKLIGPTPEGNGGAAWCIMPECPEALAPLFQIIPVQAAALRLAQLRGIAPGSFRYAPQVATNEACFNQP